MLGPQGRKCFILGSLWLAVQGLGLRVSALGFRVWGLGPGLRIIVGCRGYPGGRIRGAPADVDTLDKVPR